VSTSLKVHHLGRYKDVATLLVKHGRADGLRRFDPDDPSGSIGPDDAEVGDDARRLAEDLESMGPTFVKLGQLLSTRTDLLPPAYLDALARLQDHVEPIPSDVVEQTVAEELGVRVSKAFRSFDPKPVASASLGQVHRAELRDGRPVAVKVQRPGVRAQVADDIEVIEELAEFADKHSRLGRSLGFRGMVDEFRRAIEVELDYRVEAEHLRRLGTDMAPHELIVVPHPVDSYTTTRVLTMDWVDGRNVGSLGPLALLDLDGHGLATGLFEAYLDQILVTGFVHADPHPGNVLLTDDGRVALVDVGMVTYVDADLQDALVRLLLASSDGDGAEVAAVMTAIGHPRPGWDQHRFNREITALVQQHQAKAAGQLEMGRLVGAVARVAGECGLRPPEELTMLAKTLLNLDQVATALDPGFEPDAAIRAHVGEIMRAKLLQSVSPSRLLSTALDAREFAAKLPGRVNKVMDALAEGELTLNVQGIDEKELMRGIQKLANRLTAGLVIAALIIGAAMLTRIQTSSKLFGYPSIAIVCFLAAVAAGLCLTVSTFLHDLPQRRRRRR
jgi:predicted unusual protein kinase regulating ubiquinone biosynthesis (AarF/ABC1/UbiB family)